MQNIVSQQIEAKKTMKTNKDYLFSKNYYVVRNAGWARSRNTWNYLYFLMNQLINQVFLEWLIRR